MKRFRSTFLAVGSALVIAAAATAARPRYGGTLRIETEAIVRTLDPAAPPSDGVSPALRNRLQPLVFETLVTPNLSGGLRPALATSWESDARAMRWTIRLRPGVKLHDGSTLGPAQVAAALGAKNPSWKVTTTDDAIVIERA